jgi:hypothetical protein
MPSPADDATQRFRRSKTQRAGDERDAAAEAAAESDLSKLADCIGRLCDKADETNDKLAELKSLLLGFDVRLVKVEARMDDLDSGLTSVRHDTTKELSDMSLELGKQHAVTNKLNEAIKKLEKNKAPVAAVKELADRFNISQSAAPEHRVAETDHRVEMIDRHARRNSLIAHGIPETASEPRSLLPKLSSLLPNVGIKDVCRLGKPSASGSAGSTPSCRPVKLELFSGADNYAALDHSKELREQGISLKPNLTPAQQAVKASKKAQSEMLFASGKKPFWRGTELHYWDGGQSYKYLPPAGGGGGSGIGG